MYTYPSVSPDGDRVAFALATTSTGDLWVYNARTRTRTRLSEGAGSNATPVWSPDGRYVVFSGRGGLFWVPADGGHEARVLIDGRGRPSLPAAFTIGGKKLAFTERTAEGTWVLRVSSVRNGLRGPEAGSPEFFVNLPTGNTSAAFSRDGRWLAYASSESGIYEVYVRAYPDTGVKRLVSGGGGYIPTWSPAGNQLFFRTLDQRLMVVDYTETPDSLMTGAPREWSPRRLANIGMTPNVDIAPDGKRFVVLMPNEMPESGDTRGHFILVPDFRDLIQRSLTR
jgi:Tol biopolymer transport system component